MSLLWLAVTIGLLACAAGALGDSDASSAQHGNGTTVAATKHQVLFVHQFSSWSHCVPMVAYGRELLRRGYSVAFAAFDAHVARLNKEKASDESIAAMEAISLGSDPNMVEFFHRHGTLLLHLTPHSMAVTLGGIFELAWEQQFVGLSRAVAARRPSLMVCDIFAEACMDVARTNSIEYVVLHPSSVEHFDIDNPWYIPFWTLPPRAEFGRQSTWERFMSSVVLPLQWRWSIAQTDARKNAIRARYRVQPSRHLELLHGRRLLVEDPWTLSHPRAVPPSLHISGPTGKFGGSVDALPSSLRQRLDRALAQGRKVVLVAMGSQSRMQPAWVKAIVEGLAHEPLRAHADDNPDALPPLVVFSTAGSEASIFPPDSETCIAMAWLPQRHLLAHPATALFVSHGGQASVFEAIYNEVPLLLLPLFGDQPRNAGVLRDKHLALTLDKASLTADDVRDKARELVRSPSVYSEARRTFGKLFRLRNQHAAASGANLLEEALHVGSKHLIAVDTTLPVWYLYNLDVWAALVVVTSVSWVVLLWVGRLLFGALRRRQPPPKRNVKSE